MKFCSFSSGSDGNCYFIGTDTTSILVDAGISVRSIKKGLKRIGLPLSSIQAIFVTHDHYDHIAAVGSLGEEHGIPVYSTNEILDGINRCYKVTAKLVHARNTQEKESTIQIGDIKITSFQVHHDSTDCVGYFIEDEVSSLTIATDMGHINNEAIPYIINTDNLVIEANYDEEMLLQGHYPLFLKKRILSDNGHLANHVVTRFLSENFQERWKHIFFCHLSKENNSPIRLIQMFDEQRRICMLPENISTNVIVLPRTTSTEVFQF